MNAYLVAIPLSWYTEYRPRVVESINACMLSRHSQHLQYLSTQEVTQRLQSRRTPYLGHRAHAEVCALNHVSRSSKK